MSVQVRVSVSVSVSMSMIDGDSRMVEALSLCFGGSNDRLSESGHVRHWRIAVPNEGS